MRAIISLYDKTGVVDFASGLERLHFEIYSTGGTRDALEKAGITVHSVSRLTGFPEIMDGRVKTLHPGVHGGILARRSLPTHMAQLKEKGIQTIDLVAVNLYPFRQTISREGVTLEEALENIDIGGPTMLRSAAKNFPDVIVVADPSDYALILARLSEGGLSLEERQRLAQKAFQHVASYDTVIAQYLRADQTAFPQDMTLSLKKRSDLSYGENPHQQAALYEQEQYPPARSSLLSAVQLGGKGLSFNNILDLDMALGLVAKFAEPTVAIIKHNNPCGLASHENLAVAYQRALAGDPVAAFGGIVASNRTIDPATGEEINRTHYDVIIAPQYDARVLALLQRKRDLRILALEGGEGSLQKDEPDALDFRRIRGGFLAQTPDRISEKELKPQAVSHRQPTADELRDLLFAWRVLGHVKSNAIVIARDKAILGVGAGQPSRVASVEIALKRAGARATGSVLASDAFFPFPDGVEAAARGGVTAIIQPGGSVKDSEAISVANQYNMAMVFTGVRHFRH